MLTRRRFLAGAVLFGLLPRTVSANSPLFFLDTDLDSDIDDVAMVALLCGLVGRDQFIGATVASNTETAAPCMRALLDYSGFATVPVGAYLGSSIGGETRSFYTTAIRDELRPGDTRANYPEALSVMRETLADAPDGSVTLIAGGTLTNVAALIHSDRQLVRTKCNRVVAMGGNFIDPKHDEHNIKFDIAAAKTVATDSPIPVYWAGAEVGGSVYTGIPDGCGPYSGAWRFGASLHTNGKRQSWDLMAVLFAVLGAGETFAINGPCRVTFDAKGRTTHHSGGGNFYLSKQASDSDIAALCQRYISTAMQRAGD